LHDPASLPKRTVRQVVNELLTVKAARQKSARHIEDLRGRLNRFAEAFAVNIADVTTGDVQRWLDKLGAAPQTCKNYRTCANNLFSFAQARGYIAKGSNPVEGTERPEVKGGEIQIYTPAEVARLLAAAPANFLPCIALQAFAGLRSAEVERITWEDIDLVAGHITLNASKAKTAARRIVPVTPALGAWLSPYSEKKGLVWTGTHKDFYRAQQETSSATASKASKKKKTAAQAPVKWKANALRHSFISYRLADIQNANQVALEAGNSAAVIFKHYRELVRPDAAKAYFAIVPDGPKNIVALADAEAEKASAAAK
jgi:integrase